MATSTLLYDLNDEMALLAETAARSLVYVHANGHGGGAGTIWHPDGLIVTNAHVVNRGDLRVTFADGSTYRARLLAREPKLDLAALVVEASGLPAIALGESRRLRPGQWVVAMGHPFGVRGSATAGTVVGVGSDDPKVPTRGQEWIAVSLRLRPGNSGGPLLDAEGRLVGINTIMSGPETGMAVPVHVAKAFLQDALGSKQTAAAA